MRWWCVCKDVVVYFVISDLLLIADHLSYQNTKQIEMLIIEQTDIRIQVAERVVVVYCKMGHNREASCRVFYLVLILTTSTK